MPPAQPQPQRNPQVGGCLVRYNSQPARAMGATAAGANDAQTGCWAICSISKSNATESVHAVHVALWEHQLAPMLHANFFSGVCFAPTTIECSGVPYSTPRCPRVAQTYPRLPCSTHPLPTADFISFARAAAKSRHRITCWLGYRRGANPTASAPGLGSCLPPTSAPGSGSPLPHPHRGTVLKQSIV